MHLFCYYVNEGGAFVLLPVTIAIVIAAATLAVGLGIGYIGRKVSAEKKIKSAEEEAKRIVADA